MTISTINTKKHFLDGYVPEVIPEDTWIRNPSWLTMPTVSPDELKIVKLVAVDPGSSNVAFSMRTDKPDQSWTVDWGDGNIDVLESTSVANTWVYASHVYDHSNPLLDDTDRPATITSSVITRNNHGYPDGYKLFLNDISGPTNIYDYKEYYIVNSTTNTFQISNTSGGSPITIDADGTLNLLPYKQAIITVTGFTMRDYYPYSINNIQFSGANGNYSYDLNYLECIYSLPGCNNFGSFNRGATQHQSYNSARRMEQCSFLNSGNIYFNYTFAGCKSLRSVPVMHINDRSDRLYSTFQGCFELRQLPASLDTSGIRFMGYTFAQCYKLKSLPDMDLSGVGDFNYTFQDCFSLKRFGNYDLSSVNSIEGMFSNCQNLEQIDAAFPNVVDIDNAFSSCISLKKMPDINFQKVSTMYGTFTNCYRMLSMANDDTIRITAPILRNATQSFYGCYSIHHFDIDAPNICTTDNMFAYCFGLKSVKLEISKGGTFFRNMFYECESLRDLSQFVINTKPVDIAGMFYDCKSLNRIPYFDCSEVRDAESAFNQCYSIVDLPHDFSSGNLRNAPGMFSSCFSLETLPPLNFTNVTRCSNMFNSCYTLKNFPAVIDLSNVRQSNALQSMFQNCLVMEYAPKVILNSRITSAVNMFYSCSSLKFIPRIENFGSITDIRGMFYVCDSLREIPDLDFSGVTTLDNNSFINVWNINKFKATGLGTSTISSNLYMPHGNLSADELDNMYTNLADISSQTSRSITISNHPGRDADDPTIATAKGWTVVG
jgi:hypothetical protein